MEASRRNVALAVVDRILLVALKRNGLMAVVHRYAVADGMADGMVDLNQIQMIVWFVRRTIGYFRRDSPLDGDDDDGDYCHGIVVEVIELVVHHIQR